MACLKNRYGVETGLRYDHRITPDVIIETGYMNQDRELLTKHPAVVAKGITAGIMCYLNREEISPD